MIGKKKLSAAALLSATLAWTPTAALAMRVMDHAHWHSENSHCVFHLVSHGGRSVDIGAMPHDWCMQLIAWYNGHNDIRYLPSTVH